MSLRIGTAGWTIPRHCATDFPEHGTSLSRYASRFNAAEINSSFHRPHRHSTWERWRDSVPQSFRFSVKIPKTITHECKLVDCAGLIDEFLAQAGVLAEKLAVLLVQLPPKLVFDEATATMFFGELRERTGVMIACEPRHPSWFADECEELYQRFKVARVAADPAVCEAASRPGGWRGVNYWRLHGSPVIYRSSYVDRVGDIAAALESAARSGGDVWCIFDNTASSAGTSDALALQASMGI